MNKDRGMKKWQGFFIPETIKMVKDLWEDDHKSPRPHLDESKRKRSNGYYWKAEHQNAIRTYHGQTFFLLRTLDL